MSIGNLYKLWRSEAIYASRDKLQTCEQNLKRIRNQTTIYACTLKAMADMHRQALAVYENSPESLGETP